MKHLILTFIMLFSLTSCNEHKSTPPNEKVVEEDSLFQEYMKLGAKLHNIISIDPATFAAASLTVHYSESAFKDVIGDADSNGIFQATRNTRNALGIPNMKKMPIKEQLIQYEKFLRACSKKALLSVKNSVDLHALHFAPSRMFSKVLSKVTNNNLKALDLDNDNVITKKDLKLFQEKRIKESSQISNIYDQFFQNKS